VGHEYTALDTDGSYVKDLSYMNREIKNIVVVEFDDEKVKYHKDNVIVIPYWDGDKDDRELIDLLPFLEHLSDP